MPNLQVEEYRYSDTGLLLNGDSDGLPFVDVESISGLDNAPFRQQSHDREGTDGGYVDALYETIRTITMEGTIYTDPNATEWYLDSLKANFAPTRMNLPFYFQTDAGERFVLAKSMGINYAKDQGRRIGKTGFQLQLQCEDPRIYSLDVQNVSTTLTSVLTSGRSYPKTYPIVYGAGGSENSLTVSLTGNRDTPGKITIVGPVIHPIVVNDTTGTTLDFNIILHEGEYLDIDLAAKTVLLNGMASRRTTLSLTGTWFLLSPGDNNFRFFGTQSPATPLAQLVISAAPAWR